MKKTAITLLAIGLVIFVTTSVAIAFMNKPPKRVCYMLDQNARPLDGYRLVIATKKSGLSIKDSTGKVNFYTVQGAIASRTSNYYNMTGSGYWDRSEKRFEGHVSGLYFDLFIFNCNLYIDDSPEAFCVRIPLNVGTGNAYVYDLIEIDCQLETLD